MNQLLRYVKWCFSFISIAFISCNSFSYGRTFGHPLGLFSLSWNTFMPGCQDKYLFPLLVLVPGNLHCCSELKKQSFLSFCILSVLPCTLSFVFWFFNSLFQLLAGVVLLKLSSLASENLLKLALVWKGFSDIIFHHRTCI